jgi:hypothetical protein
LTIGAHGPDPANVRKRCDAMLAYKTRRIYSHQGSGASHAPGRIKGSHPHGPAIQTEKRRKKCMELFLEEDRVNPGTKGLEHYSISWQWA